MERRLEISISKLVTGLWLHYEGKQFPGEFVSMIYGPHDIEVSVMYYNRRGKWYWPAKPDVFNYEQDNVI